MLGKFTDCSLFAPLNNLSGIDVVPSAIVAVVSPELLKAPSLAPPYIPFTLTIVEGIVISVKAVQLKNAFSFSVVRPSGRFTSFSNVQSAKAELPISVTALSSITSGISSKPSAPASSDK